MFATALTVLELIGVAAFALSGALVASRQQMDIVGFALLAVVTGVGGGAVRDLLLGIRPVGFISDPVPAAVCVGVALVGFFVAHLPASRLRALLWVDAVGLAMFAVSGAATARAAGAGPFIAIVMGTISATFGGIIRDVLAGEIPVVLRREIYVTAALLGAAVFVGLREAGVARELAAVTGAAAAFGLRGVALMRGWCLPRYRPRPPRSPDPQ